MTENPPVQIYPNKIKNRIVFKIKTGYKLKLLTPETMKLLGSTKNDVAKDKDGETVPKLESVEFVLCIIIYSKMITSTHQKFYLVFFPSKQSGKLINISPHYLRMMNTVNTEFSFVKVWVTDQASKALEIEDNVNLTLIIG